ncbi:hypothetical protein [uncultured Roseobacter sp.]|uniref:hypothetical protein n=1 Tax=uncultured Roseobacter sp. TaxID=114847 RepID=UPI002620FE0A|nr:hypothetical protein [uncultured Roseobacter sp.]
MRDGDIYKWRWKDDQRDADCGLFGSYHCKSQLAICEGGRLFDTFWDLSPTDNSFLRQSDVVLTLLGNKNELTELKDNPEYYRPEDLVCMKHSNSSGAPTYLKPGAVRDAATMLNLAQEKQDDAQRAIESAKRDLLRLQEAMEKIRTGDLDVYL